MMKPLSQVVVRTAAWTLFFAFSVFAYGIALFGLVCPGMMARFCDTLGAYNAAGMYYERIYDGYTPSKIYTVIERYLLAGNHKKVITYAEKFFAASDSYSNFIKEINQAGAAAAQNKYDLIRWANEDSRIKSGYTLALVKTKQTEKAVGILAGWLDEEIKIDQPNHAFLVAYVETGTNETEQLLEDYVDGLIIALDTQDNLFAFDFLARAYTALGDLAQATHWSDLFIKGA